MLIFYATRHQLTSADILARTHGSWAWGVFYAAFVLLAAIHGATGIRAVMADWVPTSEKFRDRTMWSFGVVLALLGLRAVVAVISAGDLS